MNAAIYVRVSTDWQAEHGYSIDTQLEACRKKARELKADIVKEYVDNGYSGAYLERPALDELRDAIQEKLFDVIIFHDADRMSRKLIHQLLITDEIEKSGARPVFVLGEYQSSPEGQMTYQMKGVFAEYERAKIRERTMRGKRAKLRKGLVICNSHVFGYDFDKESSQYVPNEAGKKIVNEIFDMYISGKYGGMDAIAVYMTEHPEKFPPASPTGWPSSMVKAILKREMYTGEFWANTELHTKTSAKKEIRIKKPREEWVRMTCPAYITREKFDAAQMKIERSRTYKTWHRSKEIALLQGIIFCSKCGRAVSVLHAHKKKTGRVARFYACINHHDKAKPYSCGARYAKVENADSLFWEMLSDICKSKSKLREYVSARRPAQIIIDETPKLKARLQKLALDRKNIMTWYSQSLLTQEETTKKLIELKREEEEVKLKIEAPAKKDNPFDAGAVCKRVKSAYTLEEKRAAILETVERVKFLRLDNERGEKNYKLFFDVLFR